MTKKELTWEVKQQKAINGEMKLDHDFEITNKNIIIEAQKEQLIKLRSELDIINNSFDGRDGDIRSLNDQIKKLKEVIINLTLKLFSK